MEKLNTYAELMLAAERCPSRKESIRLINKATAIREQNQTNSRMVLFTVSGE